MKIIFFLFFFFLFWGKKQLPERFGLVLLLRLRLRLRLVVLRQMVMRKSHVWETILAPERSRTSTSFSYFLDNREMGARWPMAKIPSILYPPFYY